jgi:hypothetical protein
MTLPITLFIDRLPDLKVNVSVLYEEYCTVESKLEDVDDHGNVTLVQKKFHLMCNNIMSEELLRLPYTKSIVDSIFALQQFNSVNYRIVLPNRCYNWHTDPGKMCVHIPLITNNGCKFVYDTRAFSMPSDGSVYIVNNSIPHTFVNAGKEPRLHLTFENL